MMINTIFKIILEHQWNDLSLSLSLVILEWSLFPYTIFNKSILIINLAFE